MPVTNGYSTLVLLKARLSIVDTTDDTIIENVLTAVSREIDGWTKTRFYTTSSDETRYYTPEFPDIFYPTDDIISVTTLKTDADGNGTWEETWASTDYTLEPYNAALDGEPYTAIRITPSGTKRFPVSGGSRIAVTGTSTYFYTTGTHNVPTKTVPKGVQVVGKFGYSSATPAVVEEACLIQSARLYKRKEAPFGVAGSGEFGQTTFIAKLDPDVMQLLDSVKKKSLG